MIEMLKRKIFIVVIFLYTEFSFGQAFITYIRETYLNPSGCVACVRSADKHFLKGVIALKPDCLEAKEKYTEFKALGSTSYMMHICEQSDKQEYQSRLKTLAEKAKEVLKVFRKCVQKTLDFGQKNSIRDFWETFETERNKCEETKHLNAEYQHFWKKLPYTGVMEGVWGITPENADMIGNLIA